MILNVGLYMVDFCWIGNVFTRVSARLVTLEEELGKDCWGQRLRV